jgi:hypothetical protein
MRVLLPLRWRPWYVAIGYWLLAIRERASGELPPCPDPESLLKVSGQ